MQHPPINPELAYAALLAAAFWLFHSFLVLITPYVVQLITQLSVMFSFLGNVAYCHGRLALKHSPLADYLSVLLAAILGTILATFSNAEGVLSMASGITIFTSTNVVPVAKW